MGLSEGIVVVVGTVFLDKIHVDDPVGAVPVHMMNGVWGTLAVGIFGHKALGLARDGLLHGGGFAQLGIQALGVFTVIVIFVFTVMTIVFKLINKGVGLRVSREEELKRIGYQSAWNGSLFWIPDFYNIIISAIVYQPSAVS